MYFSFQKKNIKEKNLRLTSAPFSRSIFTILMSPAATAKHNAGYGKQERDGSAPLLSNNSIIWLTSFNLFQIYNRLISLSNEYFLI